MESKYLKYSLEELVEDKVFISWVLKNSKNKEWELLLENNAGFQVKAKKAREIILLLRDTYHVLDEESVLEMWRNIDRFEQLHKIKGRKIILQKTISWAASILLLISLGTIGYMFLKEESYHFVTAEIENQSNDARLILPNGGQVNLKNEKTTIELNNQDELVIDQDSIIDLSTKFSDQKDDVQMNEVIIPYGKRSELLLADGTKVWLNAGSRLAFPSKFNQETREVYLEGEACFRVARNENQPFLVNAGPLDIKVLGTWFNVSAYVTDENIETVLLEGSVAVRKPAVLGLGKSEVVLKPFQKAEFLKKGNEMRVTDEPNADVSVAWVEGWFQFSRESLQSVFTKLERYYNIEIHTPENFPNAELITGKLDLKDSLEEVLAALADVAKIEFRISGNQIIIDKEIKRLPRR